MTHLAIDEVCDKQSRLTGQAETSRQTACGMVEIEGNERALGTRIVAV
ncbi:hypothetical protein [Alsobacter sp. R-9]